jgi:PII-like signaling protein
MRGTLLRFYVHENRRHHRVLLYDWLLEEAKQIGIRGGSAFRAIAGFGRRGTLHAEHFFELAGDVAVEVELAVTDDEAERMMARIRDEGIAVFYVRIAPEFGSINGGSRERG